MNFTSIAPIKSTRFLDIPIAQLSFDQAVDAVISGADEEAFSFVVTPNVDHMVRLHNDRGNVTDTAFADAYAAAGLVFCDSRVLRLLGKLSGIRLPVVTGSDLTRVMIEDNRVIGRAIAIVGGSPTLLDAIAHHVAGVHFTQHRPPMNVLHDEAAMVRIEQFVAEQRADIVLFAMGAPHSEIAAHRCLREGRSRGIGLCIGASLEFIIGEKRRAPRWIQRIGMEWAFRLVSEPRRLWRRYLVDGPRIFLIWARQRH